MTLQQLHYFKVAADCGSITKAAEKCIVSQPALSRAIKELEEELNCPLFIKVGRNIHLSEVGRQAYEKAKTIEQAVLDLKQLTSNKEHLQKISIGYLVLGHLNEYIAFQNSKVPKTFLKNHHVFTEYDDITVIQDHLIEGIYDLIIINSYDVYGLPPHDKLQFTPDALQIIVSKKSPFFNRDTVDIKELAAEHFILYPNNDVLNDAYINLCKKNGFDPIVAGYGRKMGDLIAQVMQKNAVAFCSAMFKYLETRDVHVIDVKGDLKGFHLELVKLKSNANPAATKLFNYLKQKTSSDS